MSTNTDQKKELFRHTVATLAYRAEKTLRDAPATFAGFRANETSRTPGQILAHMGDLLDWALRMAQGKYEWHDSIPLAWDAEVARFFDCLQKFDAFLAGDAPLGFPVEKMFQGPIADALTHVGQLAMLRRMAGAKMRGESYFKAEITVGRVGPDQSAKRVEFD